MNLQVGKAAVVGAGLTGGQIALVEELTSVSGGAWLRSNGSIKKKRRGWFVPAA